MADKNADLIYAMECVNTHYMAHLYGTGDINYR